jgi:hypothetical protein
MPTAGATEICVTWAEVAIAIVCRLAGKWLNSRVDDFEESGADFGEALVGGRL